MKLRFALALLITSPSVAGNFAPSADDLLIQKGRAMIAREYPEIVTHMARQDGFGGAKSALIARAMLSTAPEVVAETRAKMTIEPHGKGMWLIRFPYVNIVLIETRDSLVLFDSGYASIGVVLKDVIPMLSKKPLKTIFLSHTHVDHSYGARELVKMSSRPRVIASAQMLKSIDVDLQLGGSIGRYNNQPLALQPSSRTDIVIPDETFEGRKVYRIGGEIFIATHAPGETEDQIWLSIPGRKTIVTADYYQGFLPNAGNGKRIQRHVEEWASAFREMAALKPEIMLPMHGAALEGSDTIGKALITYADAFDHILKQVVARLNAGERKDVIAATIDWPERFASTPLLDRQYNRPEDIARMIMKRWTGWWDDIPSHFAAMTFDAEAREVLRLAGGVEAIEKRARTILPSDPKLAARLADWAYFGAPDDPRAQKLAIDVYIARIAEPDMPVQEGIIYLDMAARARARLEALTSSKP